MIKIDVKNINEVLKFHYTNVISQPGKKWSVLDYLDRRVDKSVTHDERQMYYLLKSKVLKDKNGFSLITASPRELFEFSQDFEEVFSDLLDSQFQLNNGNYITHRSYLSKVFFYEDYEKWKAYELAYKIGVNVCPYCNRSYTFILGNDARRGTRFQYDHFFKKSHYTYLSLSFFNLIPSCHICNSNFKGEKDFYLDKNIHPYLEGFSSNIVFSILPKNVEFINGNSTSYRIRLRKGNDCTWEGYKIKAAIKNASIFEISKLYNMHKDYVDELIQKSVVYSKDYINDLYKNYDTLFRSEDDVKSFVLGNYILEKDYSKRPLSKLTADISKELGLI